MALTSSREAPQPLGRIVEAVGDWVGRLGEVWVEAQIVELRRRAAQIQFLTLRDVNADFSCSATATAAVLDAAGPLPEGSRVVARVKPRLYTPTSRFSFTVLEIQVAGEGRLLLELEQRKRKLQAEGLFDVSRKRPIPFLPSMIGLVTGRDSDAERDVLRNMELRWPGARFRVEHALVQGAQAAASVMQALAILDDDPAVDVIIIARGGGSLEDLLPFSDEGVVRAVAKARTPVISAIGHERDTPILDLVADLRASTPTDAAKRVVPDVVQELAGLDDARARIRAAVAGRIDIEQRRLDELRSRPVITDPTRAFAIHDERLALLRHQLRGSIDRRIRDEASELGRLLATVRATSPKRTLERGYAVLVGSDGALSSIADATVGEQIHAYLADGELGLTIDEVTERNRND
uniref:exodeoxyribonuclease VII large subunit n=1 Tax=Tessaracoccus timonensis TaxID=2161816 RepID=UPI000D55DF2F|nr:exodeoxyribonuclease VII large subunit [Tessaracoccus timonensis]